MAGQSEKPTLRLGRESDTAAILGIYAPYIENTPITFETDVPALESFEARLRGYQEAYPLIVAERNGVLAGYAYAHRCGERAAYAWNAELSVYLNPRFQGAGIGRALCKTLIELLTEQGIRNVFSLITVPNAASIGLHESMGFTYMGTQKQAGYKCGAWHDVAWYQKQIGSFSGSPEPIVPTSELDKQLVENILESAWPLGFDAMNG